MRTLSEMFHMCAYDIKYEKVGKDVNYAFVEKGKTLYIFFQGSNSIWDWVRNLSIFKKPYKDMKVKYKVHSGFLSAWKAVEDIVINKIKEVNSPAIIRDWYSDVDFIDRPDYKFNKIISVGYSHGGAVAGLCHECVWYNRPDIRDNIFGFGFESPRFYHGLKVKKELKERWQNFIVIRNYKDIVTFVPPAFLHYIHVGQIITLTPKSTEGYKLPKIVSSHYPRNVYNSLVELETGYKV